MEIFFFIFGIFLFLNSPYLVRFSKKNNAVTQEHKFIWDKEYKITKLCKISDIAEAKKAKFWALQQGTMFLLREGKEIFPFPPFFRRDAQSDVNKINNYLHNPHNIDEDLVLRESILRIIGFCFIVFSTFILYNN